MEAVAEVDLPDELISKILVRLPVKSLIRFKCVSKSWFSIISNPHFANSHFQLNEATHTRRILFLTAQHISAKSTRQGLSLISIPQFLSLDLPSLFSDYSHPVPLNPNFPLSEFQLDLNSNIRASEFEFYLKFKGSCRGFIFLQSSSNAYIWNPSTGVHREIPFAPNCSHLTFFGFGYDESTDDYLVVAVSYYYLGIFSLRANAWEEIMDTVHLPYCRKPNSFVLPLVESVFNGAIHWLGYSHVTRDYLIVAFDLMERKFVEIPIPDDIDCSSKDCGLWVFRGFLSLWVMVDEDIVEIWVMKEYKVKASWTKTHVLSTYGTIDNVSLVCCTNNGDIVGTDCRTGLVRYDEEGEFLEHMYYCKDSNHGFRLAMYTESLLSLPSDGDGDGDSGQA